MAQHARAARRLLARARVGDGRDLDAARPAQDRQRAGERARRRGARVPGDEDPVEGRRRFLDVRRRQQGPPGFGEQGRDRGAAGATAGLGLLDDDEVEAAREAWRVGEFGGVESPQRRRMRRDPRLARLATEGLERGERALARLGAAGEDEIIARLRRGDGVDDEIALGADRGDFGAEPLREGQRVSGRYRIAFEDDQNVFDHDGARRADPGRAGTPSITPIAAPGFDLEQAPRGRRTAQAPISPSPG